MAKENTILAIDVGGSGLKMAEFTIPLSGGGMILNSYAIEEYGDEFAQGEFLDGFAVTYRRMLAEHNFTAKQVRLSISGQAAFSRLSKLPPLAGQREQLARIIEFEARQTVPYPMDEVAWAYQLIRHSGDASVDIDEAADSNDELEALYVAVKADLLSQITDVVQDSGKDILSIEVASTAEFNAAKANQLGENGCDMILDIGGRSSSLVFVERGRIFVRSIPIAGDAITQQIAKEFNISFADAEELKRRQCFVALGGAYEDPDSQVAATISKIARNVMTRLHGEVSRSINLWRSQYSGSKPERLFLCGGSSIIPYTPHFFCEKLRVPVEYLNVFPVVQIADGVDKDALKDVAQLFAPLIGLGLRHAVSCPVQISLMSQSILRDEALRRRKPFFYASAISAIFCIGLLLFGLKQRTNYDEKLYQQSEGAYQRVKAQADKVASAKSSLDAAIGNYDTALSLIDKRDRWNKLMKELQNIMPETMWITYLEPYGADIDTLEGSNSGGRAGGGMGMPDPMMMMMMMGGGGGMGGGMAGGSQGGMSVDNSKIRKVESVEWVVIEGHALTLADGIPPETVFQNNIRTRSTEDDAVFAGGDEESYIGEYNQGTDGSMNISSFRIRLRLKEAMEQQ